MNDSPPATPRNRIIGAAWQTRTINLANVYQNTGRPAEAVEFHGKYVAIFQGLAAEHPEDASYSFRPCHGP